MKKFLVFVFLLLMVSLSSSESVGAPLRSGVAVAEDDGVQVKGGTSLVRRAGTTLKVPRVLKKKKKKNKKVPKAAKSKKVTTSQPSSQPTNGDPCAAITTQKGALLALKAGFTNGDTVLADWDNSTDPCTDTWPGITCGGSDVTGIFLINKGLSGTISPLFGCPTSLAATLTILSFAGNSLTGSIPTEIVSLTSLTGLTFATNSFTGSIPTEIGSLTSLTNLYLGYNSLTGSIPTEIGSLTSLTNLYLDNNDLSGAMPTEICALLPLDGGLIYDTAEVTCGCCS